MSTETLKFFEDKSTEEIINWMLSNLSEDQIRMCLDQSGIPDTSGIKISGKQPIAAEVTPPQTITLPDGSQKQLQPGEGSSTDPLPRSSQKRDASKIFLDKYRKKCDRTGYLIKSVTKEGVEYYEFKEVENGDNVVSPGVSMGDVGWVKKIVPISQFKDFCTDEDREIFEFLKEENKDAFLNAPYEVIEVAADYPTSGLESPLPVTMEDITPEPTPSIPVIEEVQITEPMLKALRIQQASSDIIKTNYPVLYSNGLTMYPVFVYGSESDLVLHLTTVVVDGKLTFIKDSTNKKLLNSKFKKITTAIQSAMEAGMYTPSNNIQNELNDALKSISEEIIMRISKIYDPIRLQGYTYFGTLEDELSQESFDMPNSQDLYEDMLLVSDTENEEVSSKNKKVSDMSIPEIEERMRIQFGEQYVRDYKPEKYVNSLGFTNVRYVKRPNCPDDKPVMISRPMFTEFQGKPSVNEGPGKFGEIHSDSDSDLLFD